MSRSVLPDVWTLRGLRRSRRRRGGPGRLSRRTGRRPPLQPRLPGHHDAGDRRAPDARLDPATGSRMRPVRVGRRQGGHGDGLGRKQALHSRVSPKVARATSPSRWRCNVSWRSCRVWWARFRPCPARPATATSQRNPPPSAPSPADAKRFLIVNDDALCGTLLAAMLSPFGQCHFAYDGHEAVDAVRLALEDGRPYDAICLDIMMPHMNGHDALAAVRQRRGRARRLRQRRRQGPHDHRAVRFEALHPSLPRGLRELRRQADSRRGLAREAAPTRRAGGRDGVRDRLRWPAPVKSGRGPQHVQAAALFVKRANSA